MPPPPRGTDGFFGGGGFVANDAVGINAFLGLRHIVEIQVNAASNDRLSRPRSGQACPGLWRNRATRRLSEAATGTNSSPAAESSVVSSASTLPILSKTMATCVGFNGHAIGDQKTDRIHFLAREPRMGPKLKKHRCLGLGFSAENNRVVSRHDQHARGFHFLHLGDGSREFSLKGAIILAFWKSDSPKDGLSKISNPTPLPPLLVLGIPFRPVAVLNYKPCLRAQESSVRRL